MSININDKAALAKALYPDIDLRILDAHKRPDTKKKIKELEAIDKEIGSIINALRVNASGHAERIEVIKDFEGQFKIIITDNTEISTITERYKGEAELQEAVAGLRARVLEHLKEETVNAIKDLKNEIPSPCTSRAATLAIVAITTLATLGAYFLSGPIAL